MKVCQTCKGVDYLPLRPNSRYTLKDGTEKENYLCSMCNTARMREYRETEHGAAMTREAIKVSTIKHSKKQTARIKVREALKSGKITKPLLCEVCEEEKVLEAHHNDYSKPLSVNWYCRQCHAYKHRGNKIKDLISIS